MCERVARQMAQAFEHEAAAPGRWLNGCMLYVGVVTMTGRAEAHLSYGICMIVWRLSREGMPVASQRFAFGRVWFGLSYCMWTILPNRFLKE